jgi:hypothetical protein
MGLDKPATGPGFFGWPIKAQARRPLACSVLVIPDYYMNHEPFVSVDLVKQGSMSSVNTFGFSTPTTSSLALIPNAKKFSTVSCVSRIMQHLSTTAFSFPGHHSIESVLEHSGILATSSELINTS